MNNKITESTAAPCPIHRAPEFDVDMVSAEAAELAAGMVVEEARRQALEEAAESLRSLVYSFSESDTAEDIIVELKGFISELRHQREGRRS